MPRALLALCLLALAACGETPKPFRPDDKGGVTHPDAVIETPEFAILAPQGVTDSIAQRLPIAILLALRGQGIVATTNANGAPRTIEVAGQPRQSDGDLRISWVWTVRDAKGGLIGRHEQIVSATPDEWLDGSDRLISRVAARGAYAVADMLGRADPANAPAGAQTTVLQPTEVPPAGGVPGITTAAATPPIPGEAPAVTVPPRSGPAARFPRVRVVAVTGAPGNGNRSLTAGMRRALGESQVVLVDAPDATTMTVAGSVEISPPAEGKQRIVIRWVLKGPGGDQLGDLEQANTIKAGALNGEWGGVAHVIALAASAGILELLERAKGAGVAPR